MAVTEAPPATGNGLDPGPQDPHGGDEFTAGDADPNRELLIVTGDQLTLNVGGGKQPTSATLRLVGGKIEVDGQYKKGAALVLRIEAVVNEVAFKDEHDSQTGQVVGCARNHRARVTGVSVLEG